jgi:hypothetical protein
MVCEVVGQEDQPFAGIRIFEADEAQQVSGTCFDVAKTA